jgi:hypothetical protein
MSPPLVVYALAGAGFVLAIGVLVYDVIAWRRRQRRKRNR